jgi:hypothetical protein
VEALVEALSQLVDPTSVVLVVDSKVLIVRQRLW